MGRQKKINNNIRYKLLLKRKPLFVITNCIIPAIMLSTLSLASFLFLNSLFFIPFSQAATTEEIIISAPTHRLLSGKFIDEGLGEQLKPDGKLGQIFYLSAKSKPKFLIDMSTIEEISDISALAIDSTFKKPSDARRLAIISSTSRASINNFEA